ncbi:MAG: aldo/keto reductase [Armatimonadota bacterium]|nr:aldo/keto reductase [Armatimonadota bacterium]
MELRQLGTSDLRITPIVLGTWAIGGWWWGGTDDEAAGKAVEAAVDEGINCIDTAPVYGFGHSERIVGEAISGRREEVVVATKCGLRWDREEGQHFFDDDTRQAGQVSVYRNLRRDSILEECEQSLKRLGVDVIDLYQCHWPDPTTPIEETMGALTELLDQGVIRAIGVSNFSVEQIQQCLQHGPLHSSQPRFSLLQRASMEELIPFCDDRDVANIVYSSLEQGILTGKVTPDRQFEEGDKRPEKNPWFQEGNLRQALAVIDESLRPVAEAHDATLAQTALAWTIWAPGITAALAGARRAEQARENAAAMEIELSEEQWQDILTAFQTLEAKAGFG